VGYSAADTAKSTRTTRSGQPWPEERIFANAAFEIALIWPLSSVAFSYTKNHVHAQLNALAGLRFLVSARRLTSGSNFLFQRCDALFQVLHRTDTDRLVRGS
jgi:hypothetical protein